MSVTTEQIVAGIIKYIDSEIAPKAIGFTKLMIYFVAPSVPKLVSEKIAMIKSGGLMNDLFDENGNINLDEVYTRAKTAISRSGKILIPQINYFLDETDVDMLYNIIKKS